VRPYAPHLTVGRFETLQDLEDFKNEFNAKANDPVSFHVDALDVLTRTRDTAFEVNGV
jgi:hypothetical protein